MPGSPAAAELRGGMSGKTLGRRAQGRHCPHRPGGLLRLIVVPEVTPAVQVPIRTRLLHVYYTRKSARDELVLLVPGDGPSAVVVRTLPTATMRQRQVIEI